jgi:hypothetical protein
MPGRTEGASFAFYLLLLLVALDALSLDSEDIIGN